MANLRAIATLAIFPSSPHRQVEKLAAPFLVAAHCDLRGLHQQETQQRAPLFRDISQPATIPTELLWRYQSRIARDLLAAVNLNYIAL